MEDTEELQIWTMVHHKSLGPIVMEWNGVIIAPFAFTSYDEASFALADETLPEDLRDEITVVPESSEEFKAKVLLEAAISTPKLPVLKSTANVLLTGNAIRQQRLVLAGFNSGSCVDHLR